VVNKGLLLKWLLILPFLLGSLALGSAQTTGISGRVVDPSQVPLANAQIQVVSENGAPLSSATSNQDGLFSISLQPGNYTIKIEKHGFAEFTQTIQVSANHSDRVDFALQISPLKSTVNVRENAGYVVPVLSTTTKTATPLRDVPQTVNVVTQEQIKDQMLLSIGDVVRYMPGITAHQGENNRDQVIIRGVSSSADFFVNGVRDDVQYYRDLYNLERVEALKGPNAMIFGRGGAGGVINRVIKEPSFVPFREITLEGGSFNDKRISTDFDQPFNDKVSMRFNGVFENSDTFRDTTGLTRYGFAPSLKIAPSKDTDITLEYENFRDYRGADRGIPSFDGLPVDVPNSRFYGDPDLSRVRAVINIGQATITHRVGNLNIRNSTLVGDYNRGYQNYVPGAVNSTQTAVALSAYNNATARRNLFNQTDLVYTLATGPIKHVLLGGTEVGGQWTDNFRNTGFFNNTATSISVPYDNPTIHTPITFRQSATDADNHLFTNVLATYAQDQIDITRYLKLIAGVRFDHFDLQYHNNRTDDDIRRIDNLVSPRFGVVLKPYAPLSIYYSYSVSYLPSSGDQFSSLTDITQQVKPEKFENHEIGVKWDASRSLSFTSAVYLLDRSNTRATDPNDPTHIIQTGSTRANGAEFGVIGNITRKWRMAGGYAYQNAYITSATTAALPGRQVAMVPHHSFSLWNNYQILPRLGGGIGLVNRSDMFAAVDDTVTLPGYTRVDGALFYSITERMRLQVNVENIGDKKYFVNADGNNNISFGYPRAIRAGLIARF
jgi:catecholate siderophore receptor